MKKVIDLLVAVEVDKVDWVEHEGDADLGEFFTRRIMTVPQFAPLKQYLGKFNKIEPYVFEQIDPYLLLAAISHNAKNENLPVEWRNTAPLGDGLETMHKFLIVTEGSTDGHVLKKAMEILRPNVADFFDFIDMKENYPFGSAGSLSNFFMGLCKIGTDRQIVFIFDNDAEGHSNLLKLKPITHPSNFIKLAMPDMPEFANFKTIGPNGNGIQDVNKRAVAIEMYLDHKYKRQGEVILLSAGQVLKAMLKNIRGRLNTKRNIIVNSWI